MKNIILVLIGIIVALLIVGGAVAYTMNNVADDADSTDSSAINEIIDKVEEKASSQSSSSSQSTDGGDSSDNDDIVSEEVKFNAQEGDGYYREVTYRDGGFRQYDTESGELIGSSYDSDQDQLPSME